MSQTISPEIRIEAFRRKSWNDYFFFAKYILGFNLMEINPHKELCDVLMALAQPMFPDIKFNITTPWVLDAMNDGTVRNKSLTMLPRGSFKSTVATTGFPIWLLWHNPNLRVMIDTETLSNAKFYLGAIKNLIVTNEILQAVAVDDKGKYILAPNYSIPGGFNEDSIILAARTVMGRKEPSIFCSGVDNARTGMHMEVLIMDDLVSERNTKTPEQIEKVKEHYRFSLSLIEPTGSMVLVIGTRYHMDDLYDELIKSIDYWVIVRPAILPTGELYFPTRLTQEFLDAQKRAQGSYIFSSQYMLTPLSGDDNPFKDQDIMRYRMGYRPALIKKGITIDLAISEKETADNRVILAWGQTESQDIYALDCVVGKFTPYPMIEHLFRVAEKYGIIDVGIEVVAYQKAFIYMLQAEMKRRGKFLRIHELKAKGSKMERAMGFVPYVEQHKFYVREDMHQLVEEMVQFPFAKHD